LPLSNPCFIMRKQILLYILFTIPVALFAQSHDYIWHFGQSNTSYPATVLDFNYPNDSIYIISRDMWVGNANTSICDSTGNLLFYTNGIYIADSSHQMMLNGDSLNPGLVAQNYGSQGYPMIETLTILPVPQQDSLYHLFHISLDDAFSHCDKLYFTTINMNRNGGKGEVVSKNQILLQDSIVPNLEAVKHANGEDWWILIPEAYNNSFYRFLLTKDSIAGPYHQTIGATYPNYEFSQASFSPDGTKYAKYDYINDLDIFDFDRCTGLLSNHQSIFIYDTADIIGGGVPAGLAFSQNSQYLYAASGLIVHQFDILASNIPSSRNTVATYDGYTAGLPLLKTQFYLAQLAPNGKIYLNSPAGVDVLHVIHSPDSAGAACNFEQHGVQFPNYNAITLPNFPHYRTPPLATPCDTMTNTIVVTKEITQSIQIYPNPTAGKLNVETSLPIQKIMVYNALGQIVQQQVDINTTYTQIKTSNLENGSYFIAIFIENEIVNKTFQVLR